MKKKIYIYFVFIFIGFIDISYAEEIIAFIDMNLVLKNSNFGKSILSKITELDKNNINKLRLKKKKLKKKLNLEKQTSYSRCFK